MTADLTDLTDFADTPACGRLADLLRGFALLLVLRTFFGW